MESLEFGGGSFLELNTAHENNTVALEKNIVAHCSTFRLFVVDIVLP